MLNLVVRKETARVQKVNVTHNVEISEITHLKLRKIILAALLTNMVI